MQFTTVRSKEKDYDIYLKSEKLIPAIQIPKFVVHKSFEQEKLFRSNLEIEKSGSLLLEDHKMQSTNVWNMKKEDDSHFEPEKLFPSFWSKKKEVTAISSQKNGFAVIWTRKKVDACYLEPQKCSL